MASGRGVGPAWGGRNARTSPDNPRAGPYSSSNPYAGRQRIGVLYFIFFNRLASSSSSGLPAGHDTPCYTVTGRGSMTGRCRRLPPTSPGNHHSDGPQAGHALTFKLDHSSGADHVPVKNRLATPQFLNGTDLTLAVGNFALSVFVCHYDAMVVKACTISEE